MTRVTAVAATNVDNTGTVDFSFLHYAGPDTYNNPWGTLLLVDGEGGINPLRGMQQGDWSSPKLRWNLNLFRGGSGMIIGGGIDFTADATSLAELLREPTQALDAFTVLTTTVVLEHLRAACQMLDVELDIKPPIDGTLATSNNPVPGNR